MRQSYKTLIDPQQLAALIAEGGQGLRLIDCRFDLMQPSAGEHAYRQAHLAGAVYAHLDRDLSAPIVPGVTGRHPLPAVDAFVATLCRWGIDEHTQVVVYDDKGGMFAARLWWMLRWLGHEAVAVLDGGLQAAQAVGLVCDGVLPEVNACNFQPRLNALMVAEVDAVVTAMGDDGIRLLDARGFDRYCGENETIDPVAGHIPTALSAPFMANLVDGRFKLRDELRARYQALLGGSEAIVYCGSGVTAAHDVLAMTHAGIESVRLYPGSWSHWITDPARPVATGSDA